MYRYKPKYNIGGRILKRLQEGGPIKRTSVQYGTPEYKKAYEEGRVATNFDPSSMTYDLQDLPEFTVTGKDERVKDSMSKTGSKFWNVAADLLSEPQRKTVEGITGTYQYPSEAMGIENPIGAFAVDALADPMSLLGGIGAVQGPARKAASKAIREGLRDGVVPVGYGLSRIKDIPENIQRVRKFGMQKRMPDDIKKAVSENPHLGKRYFETLKLRDAPWETYLGLRKGGENMKFTGIDPKTGLDRYELSNALNPLNKTEVRRLQSDLSMNLNEISRLNSPVVDKDKVFDIMGGYSQFLSPDKKSLMYRDIWDLQPLKKKEKLPKFIKDLEVSSFIPDAKPFVSEGKLADIKTRYTKAGNHLNMGKRFKLEKDHITDNAYSHLEHISEEMSPEMIKSIENWVFKTEKRASKNAKENLLKQIKEGKTFLNNSYQADSYPYLDISPYIKVKGNPKKVKNVPDFGDMNDVVKQGVDLNLITKPLTPFTKNELTVIPGQNMAYRKIGNKKGLLDLIDKKGAQAPAPMKMKSGMYADTPFFGMGKKPNENYGGLFSVEIDPYNPKYNWTSRVAGTDNYGVAPLSAETGELLKNLPLEDLNVYRRKWFSNNYKKLDKDNLEEGLNYIDAQRYSENLWKWGVRGTAADQILNDGDLTDSVKQEMMKYRKKMKPKYSQGGDLLRMLMEGDPSSIGGDMGFGMGSPLQMAGSIGASFIPTKSVGGKAAAGALQGASSGLAFGPIGAGIGAGVGGLTGLISGMSQQKQENEMKNRRRETEDRQFNIASRAILSNYPTQGVATSGFYKNGGMVGSDIDNVMMTGGYMKPMAEGVSSAHGKSHNDGGINLYEGMDNFAEIEDGETVNRDKVYSDTLRVPDFAMKALGMYKKKRR